MLHHKTGQWPKMPRLYKKKPFAFMKKVFTIPELSVAEIVRVKQNHEIDSNSVEMQTTSVRDECLIGRRQHFACKSTVVTKQLKTKEEGRGSGSLKCLNSCTKNDFLLWNQISADYLQSSVVCAHKNIKNALYGHNCSNGNRKREQQQQEEGVLNL